MWWGTIIGFIGGLWLSYAFIFPADLFNIKLGALTVGGLLRIFGGLVATFIAAGIGHIVDVGLGNAD
jgi:hypothetical protein